MQSTTYELKDSGICIRVTPKLQAVRLSQDVAGLTQMIDLEAEHLEALIYRLSWVLSLCRKARGTALVLYRAPEASCLGS